MAGTAVRMPAVALAFLSLARLSRAGIVGAAVIPHGDFAYDPDLVNGTGGAPQLHEASMAAGRYVNSLKPDAVFLTTPHGLELGEDFLFYLNTHLSGVSPLGDVPHTSGPQSVPMNLTTDVPLARDLLAALRSQGLRVEGLQGFSDSQPLPISWGEILPMSYLAASKKGNSTPPVVVLGMPLRRFNHSAEMVDELVLLGKALGRMLERRSERVVWVVSSDLAHTHLASGPYGFCPCAQPFDDAVQRWAQDGNSSALLDEAALQQRLGAASCGFTGLVALEGMLQELGRERWHSEVLANFHPTYYGMMAATFRKDADRGRDESSQLHPPIVV